jgi:hypothetical protein
MAYMIILLLERDDGDDDLDGVDFGFLPPDNK